MKRLFYLLAFISFASKAQTYIPDPYFNQTGNSVFTVFNSSIERAFDVVGQADDKIVVVGLAKNPTTNYFELCFIRFLANGSYDPSFGVNGKRTVSLGRQASIGGQTPKMLIDSQGRIVAANTGFFAASQDIFVCRLDTSGNLDPTFNGTGYNYIDMTGTDLWPDIVNSMTFDRSGNIWLAGNTRNGPTPLENQFAVVKVLPDGTLDNSFDQDGKKLFDPTAGSEFGRGIVVKNDGKIVAGGNALGGMYLISFDSTGNYDNSFNGTGTLQLSISGADMNDMKLDSLGNLILAGTDNFLITLVRLDQFGAFDSTLSGTGVSFYSPTLSGCTAFELQIVNGVDMIVAGSIIGTSGDDDFFVGKVFANGVMDISFNGTSFASYSFTGNDDRCYGIALLSDGRIALSGTIVSSSVINEDMGVLMLKDASQNTGISSSGQLAFASVYPNPTQQFLTIDCITPSNVSVSSIDGKVVMQSALPQGETTLDVREFAKGIYMIRNVETGSVVRFVKD